MKRDVPASEEYVIEDDFSVEQVEAETPGEKKTRERKERRDFLLFMLREHREVVALQVAALAAAAAAVTIVLLLHPLAGNAFDEAADALDPGGSGELPEFPAVIYPALGGACAALVYFWPILEGIFSTRFKRGLLVGGITLIVLSPLFFQAYRSWKTGDAGVLLRTLLLYGELLVFCSPLPLAAAGLHRQRQEFVMAGAVLITGAVFAGLHEPELDFNFMTPRGTDMILIYLFVIFLLVFMESSYLSVRLSTYLKTTFAGGTGESVELNIGRIISSFFMYWIVASAAALSGSYFALNYYEVLLGYLPEVMSSSMELKGVYGRVIFSTLFLLALVVARMILPDLSHGSGWGAHPADVDEEMKETGSRMEGPQHQVKEGLERHGEEGLQHQVKERLVAPREGRTAAPGEGRTAAPREGRTAAPGEGRTAAPRDGRTVAPREGRTAAPGEGRTAAPRDGKNYNINIRRQYSSSDYHAQGQNKGELCREKFTGQAHRDP